MFDDKRSKKVALVAHCILNQNSRLDKCADFPGAMEETVRVLVESGVGILQMPCPELWGLGLDRTRYGALDTGIREALSEGEGRNVCRDLAQRLIYQIEEYRKHGFKIVGVVGIDGSPACGVDITYYQGKGSAPGRGMFIEVLREEFRKHDLAIQIIGVEDFEGVERRGGLRRRRANKDAVEDSERA